MTADHLMHLAILRIAHTWFYATFKRRAKTNTEAEFAFRFFEGGEIVSKSHLEEQFIAGWSEKYAHLGSPERDYKFAKEALGRQWKFDFAWPAKRLAVELHGGEFMGGGHNRGKQMRNDCEKAREATKMGWRVFAYCGKDLKEDFAGVLNEVAWMLSVLPNFNRDAPESTRNAT